MSTVNIMNMLLDKKDEESLECLCKLLTTVGKDLENENVSLEPIFKSMRDIVKRRTIEVSSRVQLMLQDLRSANWMPQKHDVNPKIQAQDTNENTTFSASSKDAVPKTISRNEKVDLESLVKNKPPPKVWAAPQAKLLASSLEDKSPNKPLVQVKAKETNAENLKYEDGQWPPFNRDGKKVYNKEFLFSLREKPNDICNYNSKNNVRDDGWIQTGRNHRAQQHFSVQSDKLKSKPPQMEEMSLGSPNLFNTWGKGSKLKLGVAPPMGAQSNNIYDVLEKASESDSYTQEKKSGGCNRCDAYHSKGHVAFRQHWGPPQLKQQQPAAPLPAAVESFVRDFKLEFLNDATNDQIQTKLTEFFINKSNVEEISRWIDANVGDRVKEDKFIRALVTAILKDSIKKDSLSVEIFHRHLVLLQKYIDNNFDSELQSLYAMQSLVNEMEHPKGLLLSIVNNLYESFAISLEGFLAWEASSDPAEQAGKGEAMKQLNQFLTELKETRKTRIRTARQPNKTK